MAESAHLERALGPVVGHFEPESRCSTRDRPRCGSPCCADHVAQLRGLAVVVDIDAADVGLEALGLGARISPRARGGAHRIIELAVLGEALGDRRRNRSNPSRRGSAPSGLRLPRDLRHSRVAGWLTWLSFSPVDPCLVAFGRVYFGCAGRSAPCVMNTVRPGSSFLATSLSCAPFGIKNGQCQFSLRLFVFATYKMAKPKKAGRQRSSREERDAKWPWA